MTSFILWLDSLLAKLRREPAPIVRDPSYCGMCIFGSPTGCALLDGSESH